MTKTLPSAIHYRTPTLSVLDNRGQAIRGIAYQRGQSDDLLDERISQTTYTALGAVAIQTDARFFIDNLNAATTTNNFRYSHSLSGQLLQSASVDAGKTEVLFDIEGRCCCSFDSRGTMMQQNYDLLGRPTTVTEKHECQVAVTECMIYADTCTASPMGGLPVPENQNALGQLLYHLDPAGVVTTDSFSLSGTPLAQTRQLLATDDIQVNWPAFTTLTELRAVSPAAYRTRWQRDAAGAMILQWDAKGNRQRLSYTVAGQLKASWLQQRNLTERPIVGHLRYTAAGQVLEETAGNGVITQYRYEPETQWLIRIYNTRPSKEGRATVLQDLNYTYDPVGNIVTIDDEAQPTNYFANQKTSAQRHYSYDTLYQLITATGREDANADKHIQTLPPLKTPLPEAADGQLSAYMREYRYDRGGNLIQIRHTGAHYYTRTIEIAKNSNRSAFVHVGTDGHSAGKAAQSFDDRGNLFALSTGQSLSWNLRNQLIQATVLNRSDGSPNDEEYYRYGSDGMRVSKTTVTQRKNGHRRGAVIYLPGLELRTQNHGKEVLDVILIGEAGRCQVRVLHWEEGQPEQIQNDQFRYSLDDQIGSSVIELDSNADKLSEEIYYPYGGTALWAAKSKVEAKYKYVRYSGKERDATGLYYYGYRYYIPGLGRWLNPDPAGIMDGLNLYRMARNNPVTLNDTDGLSSSRLLYENAFQKIANKYKVAIGVRSPNALGEALLKEGYPSKNFHMKAKSSLTGPTAGFIAENEVYSKVAPSSYHKQKEAIESARRKGATSVPLILSVSRIEELQRSGNLASEGNDRFYASYPGGTYKFIINDKGEVFDENKYPVKVMTNPLETGSTKADPRPITADYDLFTIIPRKNQANNDRPLRSAPRLLKGNSKLDRSKLDFLKIKFSAGRGEDPNMGNLHQFGKVVVTSLNKEIENAGYAGGNLVWHNDETGNPFSPGFDENDKPIIFIPGQNPVQVHDIKQLKALYSNLRNQGYVPEYSPVFGV